MTEFDLAIVAHPATVFRDAGSEQPPARLVAGALAHLARHMETGCPRSGHQAALLLTKIADDDEADDHLRRHARELVEILERERHDSPGLI